MAIAQKITALVELTTADVNDILAIVDDPSSGAATKKITVANLNASAGNVTKVGTPVDNQLGIWTGDGTIEGVTALTFDGSTLGVTGAITATSYGGITEANLVDKTATENISQDWNWLDNVGIQLGSGADGRLYFNSATDDVRLDLIVNTDFVLRLNAIELAIQAIANGAVELYHNNALKLVTAIDGIDVTGDVGGTTIGGITEANLLDKSAAEQIDGSWTFNALTKFTATGLPAFIIDTETPAWHLRETSGPVNEKLWRFEAAAGDLRFQVRLDNDSGGSSWLEVKRTGTTIDTILLSASDIAVVGATMSVTAALSATTITLPQVNEPLTPTFAFGDGDTGFFEQADDVIGVSIAGTADFFFQDNSFRGALVGAGAVLNEVTSVTNPTLLPNRGDFDTGIGSATSNKLSLIAGGLDCINIAEAAAARQIGFYVTAPVALQTGVAVTAAGVHAALVNLGLITA